MIIKNLYVVRVASAPTEHDSPLIVDPSGVKFLKVSLLAAVWSETSVAYATLGREMSLLYGRSTDHNHLIEREELVEPRGIEPLTFALRRTSSAFKLLI